jgi:capsular polysaccharide biosynthesis protein
MEIHEYLKRIRHRLWLPVALPLCAALIVTAVVLFSPQEHEVIVTVPAHALIGGEDSQYTGPNAARAFAEDFVTALETRAVISTVAEVTTVPPSAITDGLHAGPMRDGGLIQVVYRTAQPDRAQRVAHQAVKEAITLLFRPQRELGWAGINEAHEAIADIDAEIDRFRATTGLTLPDRLYERKAEQLADLQFQQAQAVAADETSTAARLGTVIARHNTELRELALQARAFTALTDQRAMAVARLEAATRSSARVDAVLTAVDAGGVVAVGAPIRISQASIILRKGAAAAGAGLFLGVVLVVLLDALDLRRLPRNKPLETDRDKPGGSDDNGSPPVPTIPEQQATRA